MFLFIEKNNSLYCFDNYHFVWRIF